MTATDRGRSTCSTAATAAVRSRSSKRRRASSVSSVGRVTSSSPRSRADLARETGVAEQSTILWLPASTTAVNWRMPSAAADSASWASRTVAIPRARQPSATANATSALSAPSGTYWPWPTTNPAASEVTARSQSPRPVVNQAPPPASGLR